MIPMSWGQEGDGESLSLHVGEWVGLAGNLGNMLEPFDYDPVQRLAYSLALLRCPETSSDFFLFHWGAPPPQTPLE